ncbi:MAG: N-acetylmuramoyl-L-alanine amidase [Clostridia bacterium]|nr:N-acetylmuramoyl-L-alanine amidase [Clostridia bacterium]
MEINKEYPCRADNYSQRQGKVEYIVVHYVGATGGAKDNAMYYNREYVGNSAHFFVGHASENAAVYQSVPPEKRAWHCGSETGKYKHPYCRNDNSIGIEMCCHYDKTRGWYFDNETVKRASELVRMLMQTYGVTADRVLRHYDVTGKLCPAPLTDENAWAAFKQSLVQLEEYITPNDIVWELQARGIVLDARGMLEEMEKDLDGRLYWLGRKAVHYIRERERSGML